MALGFDAATSANLVTASTTTFAHTVAGSDRILYVLISWWDDNGETPATVTYNGVGATRVAQSALSSGNDRVEIWRLIAPATGSNNVVVASCGNMAAGRVTAVSLTGTDQTTPERDTSTNTGSSTGPTCTADSNSTDFVLDVLASDASGGGPTYTMVADSGRTQIANAESGDEAGCVSRETSPGASSEVMNWTISVSRTWAMATVTVKAAGGGGGGGAVSGPPDSGGAGLFLLGW